jgi:hypothetical protein
MAIHHNKNMTFKLIIKFLALTMTTMLDVLREAKAYHGGQLLRRRSL